MAKNIHEIRDPIHVFIKLDSTERKVLDSRPFQRLRYIHQLATTYLIYPGATHSRFEHSLGVMELASRVFDVVTDDENIIDPIPALLPEIRNKDKKMYWRRVLRMAALCHDIGHLPFSHAAEKELLPPGWNHEQFTRMLIRSNEMESIWGKLTPPLRSEDIVKLAVGPKGASDINFTDWETILSEIIVGDSFGVDRMDYLLRDSYHTGVAYGKFDHHRLIDTLRILPSPSFSRKNNDRDESIEPGLGV
jgi:HD superfamily phosphohydrolase